MSQPSASSELTSQYAAQVSGDLERNVKEQDRIGAEIAELQAQLAALQHDHSVLLNMQQVLGITPAPAEPAAEPAVEPAAEPAASPRTKPRSRKAGTSSRRRTATRASAKKARPAAEPPARPTLVDLVRGHLAEQREPRSTSEIAAALSQEHPDRPVKNTVVRTTVEGLVAKGLAQRTKQGSSVYYTAPDTDRSGDAEPQSGTTE
ncbi:hypothetical protein [Streptomyces sediminimaris]|uniref:hypothetical protein n=1 Tax=Streptomyces sediminimaris TaxID=3383721 RepID=UPI003999BC54